MSFSVKQELNTAGALKLKVAKSEVNGVVVAMIEDLEYSNTQIAVEKRMLWVEL